MSKKSGAFDGTRRRLLLGGTACVCSLGSARLALASISGGAGYDGVIAVKGSTLVNGAGRVLQLRGNNIQQQAFAMIAGASDASGGSGPNDQAFGPNLSIMKRWKMNAIRIGINEACWLGYRCYSTAVNGDGSTGWINPDPNPTANSYRRQITRQIAALNDIGCYVILTLAGTNPGRSAPLGQDWMANQDNSIQCWRSIAESFGYPNGSELKRNGGTVDDQAVMFELFNEPQVYGDSSRAWRQTMNGAFINQSYAAGGIGKTPGRPVYPFPCTKSEGAFIPGEKLRVGDTEVGDVLCYYENTTTRLPSSGTRFIHVFTPAGYGGEPPRIFPGAQAAGSISKARTTVTGSFGWYVAGHSQMLSSIRAAGAWNVCLLSGVGYDQDLSLWAETAPSDRDPPDGYHGPGWTAQIAAAWHPYPAWSYIEKATVSSGGSGYAVGDTILLPMPESGPDANAVYWQAQLQVTRINGTAIEAVRINPYIGGTPAQAGGNPKEYNRHGSGGAPIGGVYCALRLPSNPVGQYSTSGHGRGALFDLAFSRSDGWPSQSHWAEVAALRNAPGVPVVITETGEHYGAGVSGSPWMSALARWCDVNGISLIAYAYTPSAAWTDMRGGDFGVIDGRDRPTPGYGEFMFNWYTTHAP